MLSVKVNIYFYKLLITIKFLCNKGFEQGIYNVQLFLAKKICTTNISAMCIQWQCHWFSGTSQKSKRSCVCVLEVSNLPISVIWYLLVSPPLHFIVSMYFVDTRNERTSRYVKEEQDRNYTSNIFISKLWFISRFSYYYINIIFWKIHWCVKSRTN